MRGSSLEKETNKKRDEVEEMLQAAQDQVLLKLSVDSHIASASSNNYLDSDLERRFKALKSGGSSSVTVAREDQEFKAVLGDDLSARFAALKAKLNPSSSSTIAAEQIPLRPTVFNAEDENEEDEVERLIQWAKDAARLDPSPPSDDDKEEDDDDGDGDEEEEEESDGNSSAEENQNHRKAR